MSKYQNETADIVPVVISGKTYLIQPKSIVELTRSEFLSGGSRTAELTLVGEDAELTVVEVTEVVAPIVAEVPAEVPVEVVTEASIEAHAEAEAPVDPEVPAEVVAEAPAEGAEAEVIVSKKFGKKK